MALKKIVLCEGKDDKYVIENLCGNLDGPYLYECKPLGSVEKLLESISVSLKAARDEAIIGIVIDADIDLSARWQSVSSSLIKLGYPDVPKNPEPAGTILNPQAVPNALLPRVGIWLMPNNRIPGIIEDFLDYLVPKPSPLFDHVINSVDTIPESEKRFTDLAKPKVLIHTWLAWQERPGCPYGTAILAKFLDPNVPEARAFIDWLNRLYNETP